MKIKLIAFLSALSLNLALAEDANVVRYPPKKTRPINAPVAPPPSAITPSTPVSDSQKPFQPESVSASNEYSNHKYNFYLSPLGFLFGYANLAFEAKILDRVTFGPNVGFSKYTSGSSSAATWVFGGNLTFYLSEPAFNNSWFLAPFVQYATASSNSASSSGLFTGADLGYWWFWDSGLNLCFGAGLQYISVDFGSLGLVQVSSLWPSFKLSLGYAF